ncbi:hypothetical protein A2U01_0020083, partial [Trifolium medium]|nr:hypothetical protein [Trifolium medium]
YLKHDKTLLACLNLLKKYSNDVESSQTERDELVTVATMNRIDESHNNVFTAEVSKDSLVTNNRSAVDTIDTNNSQAILAQTKDVNANVSDVQGAPLQQVVVDDMEKINKLGRIEPVKVRKASNLSRRLYRNGKRNNN